MRPSEQKYIFGTIKGKNREENKDNFLIIEEPDYNIYAVFDGVSSAVNSKQGTEVAKEFIKNNYKSYVHNSKVDLDKLMYMCNLYFIEKKLENAYTTYCIVIIFKNNEKRMYFSSMGDTRIYIITKQYIEQVSDDDNYSSRKNILTKCLGLEFLEKYDFEQMQYDLIEGSILLCTDGFYSLLEEERMLFFEVINKKTLHAVKSNIFSLVSDKNSDDCTYILIK